MWHFCVGFTWGEFYWLIALIVFLLLFSTIIYLIWKLVKLHRITNRIKKIKIEIAIIEKKEKKKRPKIKQEEIDRKNILMQLQRDISREIMSSYRQKSLDVIIDKKVSNSDYMYEARAYLDAPDIDGKVFIRRGDYAVGDIVRVQINDSLDYDLLS